MNCRYRVPFVVILLSLALSSYTEEQPQADVPVTLQSQGI